jgi:ABC-type Zn uptake system ZnuABC Zn-binding protein ZnuA
MRQLYASHGIRALGWEVTEARAVRIYLLVVLLLGVAPGCSGVPDIGSGKLAVVSTVTQVSALVRAVGGDRIDLSALATSKDDPHQYELKPDQTSKLGNARVIFKSGADLDKWIDAGIDAAKVKDRVIDLSKGLKLLKATAGEAGDDPHWWYDVDNAKQATTAISQALTQADSGGQSTFDKNAADLRQRLDQADKAIHSSIDPVPPARRLFVANHDAFNYFLARYGITLVGDVIPSTDSIQAVRPADITRLVQSIKQKKVCAVFTETTIDPKMARQIADEAKVKVYDGKLYGDAIDDPGKPGGTLEGALEQNGKLMGDAFKSC